MEYQSYTRRRNPLIIDYNIDDIEAKFSEINKLILDFKNEYITLERYGYYSIIEYDNVLNELHQLIIHLEVLLVHIADKRTREYINQNFIEPAKIAYFDFKSDVIRTGIDFEYMRKYLLDRSVICVSLFDERGYETVFQFEGKTFNEVVDILTEKYGKISIYRDKREEYPKYGSETYWITASKEIQYILKIERFRIFIDEDDSITDEGNTNNEISEIRV